jgi:hypothetical protein
MYDHPTTAQDRRVEAAISRLEHIASIGLTTLEGVQSTLTAILRGDTEGNTKQLLQQLAHDVRAGSGLMQIKYEAVIQQITQIHSGDQQL